MIPFPSISQFRQVVQHVQSKARFQGLDSSGEPIFDHTAEMPAISFRGHVKLHGTNAAIVFKDGEIGYQSRNRVLSRESDNMGFVAHMSQHESVLEDLRRATGFPPYATIVIYGEWCGEGIQSGVAISQLPRMFVIFAVSIDGNWSGRLPSFMSEQARIYSIDTFWRGFEFVLFSRPEYSQNRLAEITQMVEDCCPVGKAFGVNGIGEGVVWMPSSPNDPELWFKVKGEKHSVSKVKTLAPVDIELVRAVEEFITYAVTENRLEQGLFVMVNELGKSFEMKSLGDFIRWVHGDILKEEMDVIEANGLDPKKLGRPIAEAAKHWYITKLNKSVGVV